jgi:hypothetical protein
MIDAKYVLRWFIVVPFDIVVGGLLFYVLTAVLLINFGSHVGLLGWANAPNDTKPRTVATARTMTCAEVERIGDVKMIQLLMSPEGKNFKLPDQMTCR